LVILVISLSVIIWKINKEANKEVDYINLNEVEISAKDDLIRITTPKPGDTITSPLTITGEARGVWFFEGDFPIVLQDSNGEVVAEYYASAQGEWMTEDFVPFKSTLVFENPETTNNKGTLILKKDNPSGLPEH